MPVIKSAIKKLRKDKKREKINNQFRNDLKKAIKKARMEKKESFIIKAISLIDKAAKKNIIHKNKAARIKSSLSKLVKGKKTVSESKKSAKKKKKQKVSKKTKSLNR